MQTQNTPKDYNPRQIQADIQETINQIEDYRAILNANILKVTIVVAARRGQEAINKVLTFPPGTIPKELHVFFEQRANQLVHDRLKLESELIVIRVANLVIELSAFINEYYSIDHRAQLTETDLADIEALKQLQVNTSCAIQYNNNTVTVTRIS